jgi:hypothetical protein
LLTKLPTASSGRHRRRSSNESEPASDMVAGWSAAVWSAARKALIAGYALSFVVLMVFARGSLELRPRVHPSCKTNKTTKLKVPANSTRMLLRLHGLSTRTYGKPKTLSESSLEEELLQCGGYNRTRRTKHVEAPILEVTAANHCAFVMLVPPKFLYSSNHRQSAECPPYGT